MGYFSNLATEYAPYNYDLTDTPPETQLLWRLEELKDRLFELTSRKEDQGVCFTEDNLRYVLPEHFLSASDVCKAIDLVISDLKERYSVYMGDQQEAPAMDEITGMQISLFDITPNLSLQVA